MQENIKKLIYFFLNFVSAGCRLFIKRPRVSVLMYHSVGNNKSLFTVSKKDFARQLEFLKRGGFKVVSLSWLVEKLRSQGSLADKTVALTFDDGYQDNFFNAWPLLKQNNFPATIFLPTNYIGRELSNSQNVSLPVLTSRQIKELSDSGLIEFGSHTHTHPRFKETSAAVFTEEARQSKEIIEKLTGKNCQIFSYPWGYFKEEFFDILKNQGYEAAFGVREGLITTEENLFLIKRNFIYSRGGFAQFKGKLTYSASIYNWLKSKLK